MSDVQNEGKTSQRAIGGAHQRTNSDARQASVKLTMALSARRLHVFLASWHGMSWLKGFAHLVGVQRFSCGKMTPELRIIRATRLHGHLESC